MSGNLMTNKRAARIERRKSRIATIFHINDKDNTSSLYEENPQQQEPTEKRPRIISDEEYLSLRVKLRERKRLIQNSPLFRLIDLGLSASLNLPKGSRIPVLATDVQTLFLISIIGDSSCYQPYKWCSLTKWNNLTQTLVLVVDNISIDEFENNKDIFSETHRIFEDGVEMNNPKSDGFNLDLALAYVPISNGMKKRVLAGYPSLQAACQDRFIYGLEDSSVQNVNDSQSLKEIGKMKSELETKNQRILMPNQKEMASGEHSTADIQENTLQSANGESEEQLPAKSKPCEESDLMNIDGAAAKIDQTYAITRLPYLNETIQSTDINLGKNPGCSRFELLLSASQLITEQFPLPGYEEYKNYSFTQDKYEPVTDRSPMFSVDCEWCTCIDGSNGLARVAVVDEELKTVYHTYVKPDVAIFDYLTKYSGITEEILKDVTKTPMDVQQDLRKLLPPDAILVGQSLNSDLKALKLIHPYCIDTSVIYNLTGARSFKSKLKVLAAAFCGRVIQDSSNGHDPTEDAVAAMELVLFKLNLGIEFGDVILSRGANWESPNLSHSLICESIGGKRQKNSDDVLVDQDSLIHMKLFTFIQIHNKSATLITTHPTLEKSYRPELRQLTKAIIKSKKANEPIAEPVQIIAVHDFQSAVTASSMVRFNSSFTLVHTSLEEQNLEEKWKELDKSILELYNSVSINGMMIVIFGGKHNNPLQNGACLVRINRCRTL